MVPSTCSLTIMRRITRLTKLEVVHIQKLGAACNHTAERREVVGLSNGEQTCQVICAVRRPQGLQQGMYYAVKKKTLTGSGFETADNVLDV